MLQCGIFRPIIADVIKKVANDPNNPFFLGLEVYGLGQVSKKYYFHFRISFDCYIVFLFSFSKKMNIYLYYLRVKKSVLKGLFHFLPMKLVPVPVGDRIFSF